MIVRRNFIIAALTLSASTFEPNSALAANPVTNATDLVSQHLDSIASPAIRAGLKTRVVEGSVQYTILVGGAGTVAGKAYLVFEGRKYQLLMKLASNYYSREQIVFDGKKHKIALSTPRQTRSYFGNFLFDRDELIDEGLLGGTLSTAWPLLNLNERQAKVSFNGLKKIDGQNLYELRYHPRRSTDVEINFYFDPETCRHVETTYVYSISERMAQGGPTAQVGQLPSRYRLQEKFSDFRTADGVTLPTRDDIQLSREPQRGSTILVEWNLKGLSVSNNIPVDARNFEVN